MTGLVIGVGLVAIAAGVLATLALKMPMPKPKQIGGFMAQFRVFGHEGSLALLIGGSVVTAGGTLLLIKILVRCKQPLPAPAPTLNIKALERECGVDYLVRLEDRLEKLRDTAHDQTIIWLNSWAKEMLEGRFDPSPRNLDRFFGYLQGNMRRYFLAAFSGFREHANFPRDGLMAAKIRIALEECADFWNNHHNPAVRTDVLLLCKILRTHIPNSPEIERRTEACLKECRFLFETMRGLLSNYLANHRTREAPFRYPTLIKKYGLLDWPNSLGV